MKKDRILFLCAHSDDEVIGAGGTIAKYAKNGNKVKVIIFTTGEKIVPWIKEGYIIGKRKKESESVAKHLRYEIEFLELQEGKISDSDVNLKRHIREKIVEFKPDKIFTHSTQDAHPDHQAINKIVTKVVRGLRRKPKVFTFIVWNITNPKNVAKLYVDVSDTFNDKIAALQAFKTQKLVVALFYIPIYIKARIAGMQNNCRYAEVFYIE